MIFDEFDSIGSEDMNFRVTTSDMEELLYFGDIQTGDIQYAKEKINEIIKKIQNKAYNPGDEID
jgi:Txe/YoeB family toxin of Txe-Axe toxin-antitoxin module